jgi:lipoprotein-releasing system permease protein
MSLSRFIAGRYLFSKKNTNMINVITGVSVAGLAFGTAALVLIMSVFNGFEELLVGLENALTPDVRIRSNEGKTFDIDSTRMARLEQLQGVEVTSLVLEELVLFEYGNDRQEVAIIKGVDENYRKVADIDSLIVYGSYTLQEENIHYAVPPMGLSLKLGINLYDALSPIQVYVPRATPANNIGKPFRSALLYPAGAYSIIQENEYGSILASITFVQNLLYKTGQASSIEIKLKDGSRPRQVESEIRALFGEGYIIESREDQNADLQKLIRLEKWMGYAILCLAIVLVALNLIGTLWMIVLDKKRDIAVLRALGGTDGQIRKIFITEGLYVCLVGLAIGLVLGLLIYALQQNLGIVRIPEGYIINAYPMKLKPFDLLAATAAVLMIGFLAILPPALASHRVGLEIREE